MKIKFSPGNKALRLGVGVVIALLAFAGFGYIYSAEATDYGKEFVAGCLGALITIVATAALLKSQTTSEIEKDKLAGIFQTKLSIYSEFIAFLNDIHQDGRITPKERNALVQWGLKLALVSGAEVIMIVYQYTMQFVMLGSDSIEVLTEESRYTMFRAWVRSEYELTDVQAQDRDFVEGFFTTMGALVGALRDDLSQSRVTSEEDHQRLQGYIDQLVSLLFVETAAMEGETLVLEKVLKTPRARRVRVRRDAAEGV